MRMLMCLSTRRRVESGGSARGGRRRRMARRAPLLCWVVFAVEDAIEYGDVEDD
jgi:hypothetical protein